MKKTVLFRALPLLALLGLMCTGVWAQSSILGVAPSTPQAQAEAQAKSYQDIKMARKAAAQQQTETEAKAAFEAESYQVENLKALYNEMKANANNPAYNMAASLKVLQNSPLVMYPLNQFDPKFPLVIKTGDTQADQAQYNKAKQAYLKSQK